MPGTSIAKNKNGVELHFDEGPHEYYTLGADGHKTTYTSVTELVGRFFPKFDADAIAPRVAAKRGVSTEDILREWRETADAACKFGTRVHECAEDTLRGNPLRNTPVDAREAETFKQAVAIAEKIRGKSEVLGIEKVTFIEHLKLAGTVDLFVRNKCKDGTYKYWILDYKTNKKIEQDNPFQKFGYPPFQNMPDNNFSHYTIQLNIYQRMLQLNGEIPDGADIGRALLHITPAGAFPYKIPDIQAQIASMFDSMTNGEMTQIQNEAEKRNDD